MDPNEYESPYGRGGYPAQHPPQPGHGAYYGGGRAHPSYPQQHGTPFMGGYPGANPNQMVPYGYPGNNPFSPMSNGSSGGASYFGNEPPRGMFNDVMPYGQQGGYYGAPHYNLPQHMERFSLNPPMPPPTEHPGPSTTPGLKEAPPDPEKIRLEAELAALKAMEEKAKAAERQAHLEAKIRKDAEDAFQRRMEDMRKAQEEAKKEIEAAKKEAERAAHEKIRLDRKAEEERAKQHAEAMKRAEENARMKLMAELEAADERRKKAEEERARAEEAAKVRLELAIKAEADARAAGEKRAAEEAARLKQIQDDAKTKAEAEAKAKVEEEKAAAKKKAEDDEIAKKDAEALKKRIQDETTAKIEEAAKKKTDKAPIKFKDAVGRKFSFPFHLCATWQGMEELIKQAFLQVDVLGPHVQEGHYDLTGPNGEIILPSVWEKVVEPDWAITMTMWPVEKHPLQRHRMPGMPPPMGRHGPPIPPMGARMGGGLPGVRPAGHRPGGDPPAPPGWGGGRPTMNGRPMNGRPRMPGGPDIIDVGPGPSRPSKSKRNSTMLTFLAGKPKKKSSKK